MGLWSRKLIVTRILLAQSVPRDTILHDQSAHGRRFPRFPWSYWKQRKLIRWILLHIHELAVLPTTEWHISCILRRGNYFDRSYNPLVTGLLAGNMAKCSSADRYCDFLRSVSIGKQCREHCNYLQYCMSYLEAEICANKKYTSIVCELHGNDHECNGLRVIRDTRSRACICVPDHLPWA